MQKNSIIHIQDRRKSISPCTRFLPLKFLVLCNAFPSQILRPLFSPASSTVVQSLFTSFQESVNITSSTVLWLSDSNILYPKACSNILNQTCQTQSSKAAPVYPSSHISRMLVNHTAFVNSGQASIPSLSHIPKGLEACQGDQFHLTLFKKVNPLITFHFQLMKCVLLQALHYGAAHSTDCPCKNY